MGSMEGAWRLPSNTPASMRAGRTTERAFEQAGRAKAPDAQAGFLLTPWPGVW